MSDSWQAPRPVKGSSARGAAEDEARAEGEPMAGVPQIPQMRYEPQRPPPHMHSYAPPSSMPSGTPYFGYPPPHGHAPPIQYLPPHPNMPTLPQYPYPMAQPYRYAPTEHYHQLLPQDQAYWEQHQQQMRLSQYPPQHMAIGRGEYPSIAGALSAASGTSIATADTAAAGSVYTESSALGATASGMQITPIDSSVKRTKKNIQSRARAAQLRQRMEDIKKKPAEERTEEEAKLFRLYEERREKKNERSRERAIEKKCGVERVLAIPEDQRTEEDNLNLHIALKAKLRKNEGDRMRRERIKKMGLKSGTPSRSRGRPKKQQPKEADSSKESEATSPLQQRLPHSETSLTSPSVFMSPGLMPSIGFPSPASYAAEGGRSQGSAAVQQMQIPMIPGDASLESSSWSQQLHLPQRSSQVQQRRHPDGSMTVSIFGAKADRTNAAAQGDGEDVGNTAEL